MRSPTRVLGALLCATFFLGACPGDGFYSDDGGPPPPDGSAADSPFGPDPDYGDQTVPEGGACTEVIDLVFVLDISSSMIFILEKLEAEIDVVVTAANQLAPDSHFGLVTFVDNHALDTTGPLEGGAVHTASASLQQAFAHYRTVYTLFDRNPGDGPGGPTQQNPICEENAADALHAAATAFPWRQDATRVIILATDDTFLERPDNYGDRDGDGKTDKTDPPREGDYPAQRTLAEVVAALKAEKVRVFSFTRLHSAGILDLLRCGTGRRFPWGAISNGWSTPYNGSEPIPAATDGKNFDLELVQQGQLSLAETINNVVVDSRCNPIL